MAYPAYDFIYNGTPSEKLGLFICSIGSGRSESLAGGGNVSLITDKTLSMQRNYLLGIEYDDVFEIPLTFGSYEPVDRFSISLINNLLIGQQDYKKLQIVQDDMKSIYYNCILTDFKITTFGNLPYAFECKAICDRPWGLGNKKVERISLTDNVLKDINVINTSHTSGLTYPTLSFTTTKANSSMSIINVSNNNYETKFEGLSSGETITLNSELQIIKSSTVTYRLEKFNKHWFELLPSLNKLKIKGNSTLLTIEYDPIRKMG